MKAKLSEIIAQALIDLGVSVVTNVPGLGGSQVFTEYNLKSFKQLPISFHEEVAYTIAHSGAICGKRSVCLLKAQGVVKAMNSVTDSLFTDVTAGFVTIIFEDSTGKSSDNILDIEPILKGAGMKYKLAKPESMYEDVISAFIKSENHSVPVALIVDAYSIEKEFEYNRRKDFEKTFTYQRDIYHHVVHPYLAEYQYKIYSVKKLEGDREAIKPPTLPKIPDNLPDKYKADAEKYLPFFEIFKEIDRDLTTGDTSISSSFAFPPYNAIDIVTYIGGSIPLAAGAYLAGNKNVWAMSGDFGFMAAGHLGLIEVVNRQIPLKIVIFNNKSAGATGGQKIDKKVMLRILAGYEKFIDHIPDATDVFELEKGIKNFSKKDGLGILLVEY